MRRIIILLLLFSMAVCPPAATAEETQGADIPGAAETQAKDSPEITLFDVRYYFEHRLLPQAFYEAPIGLMESLRKDGLYDRWKSYTAGLGFSGPYSGADFGVRDMMQDSGIRMMLLTMPKPESMLLCYRIYLCFDPSSGTAAYYTAEYDLVEGFFDEGCLLCGWKPGGTHQYYAVTKILPDSSDPGHEKALAEEATAVLNLMREEIAANQPETVVQIP